jgi:hypothetical protein
MHKQAQELVANAENCSAQPPRHPAQISPPDICRKVCVRWTGEWEASDGRHNDCCPYPADKKCIGTKCTKKYQCTLYMTRCDGGVPQPPPEESPDSVFPGFIPGGGTHLGPTDPGTSIRQPNEGVIITTPPTIYLPPPAPLYTPPPVQTYRPPIRHTQPPQIYVRPPQVQMQTEAPPIRTAQPPQTYVRPPQVQTQRPPQVQTPSTSVSGYTTRPPQQGVTTRPPQQGVSTSVQGTRTNQVNKPPCRCLKQETYWHASDGRHKTCCPNPQQKRCIATKCEQRTRCLQWGPPGCVR